MKNRGCLSVVLEAAVFATVWHWTERLQGLAVVSRWGDGRFLVEHVRWDGQVLVWRDERIEV